MIDTQNTLGTIQKIDEDKELLLQDHFQTDIENPFLGKWGISLQSTPSALMRVTPLIIVCVVSLLILATINTQLSIVVTIIIVLVLMFGIYVVVFKPDRAVVINPLKTAYSDKASNPINTTDADIINYQPDTNLITAKKSNKK